MEPLVHKKPEGDSSLTEVRLQRFQVGPWNEITDAARKRKADLIIIGTHGYSGLKHTLLGSSAERVVRHAPCPVLVVRERGRDFV